MPFKVYGKTDLTPDQWKQLEDQRKMKALFKIIKAKERHAERLANAGKVKYEYDSDEEVDGGTWEHRRRMEEMEKTKVIAQELTENAHGRHHIGNSSQLSVKSFSFLNKLLISKATSCHLMN